MDVESLSLDLDVLLYTIRSSNEISDINTIEKEIKATKQKIIEINPLFQVLESYDRRYSKMPSSIKLSFTKLAHVTGCSC